MKNTEELELLSKAMETFNTASSSLLAYYSALEDKVKLLTQEVEHKKQQLDCILDSIDIGVIFFDTDSKVTLLNKSAENLLGVTEDELMGTADIHAEICNDTIVPENAKPFPALYSETDVLDRSGRAIGRVLVFKDITRLRELEAENEHNRRLTAMGELVLKIAHEVRNPLGSIELFASLIYEDLKGTRQAEYAGRISDSVRSLVNTLDNMLRYSRGMAPRFSMVSFSDTIEELSSEFAEMLETKSVEMVFFTQLSPEQGIISMDKGLMRQALINVFLNAMQAMPDGGRLTVSTSRDDNNNFVISIKDTGTGMDEDTVSKIFEPFYSTKDRGTGLGMSITQSVVEAHSGSIKVKSEPGAGTDLTITLPQKIS
ncbi:MAG: ATP-binding protein [Dissulfurispiraceae bacterium]|jgi:signal transduction histidine kinase|nr:ATP-binding protein [Dissulfurispiraceae bacterium]